MPWHSRLCISQEHCKFALLPIHMQAGRYSTGWRLFKEYNAFLFFPKPVTLRSVVSHVIAGKTMQQNLAELLPVKGSSGVVV